MATSVGALSSVGLARESAPSYGAVPGVAATVWLPFLSESFKDGPEAIQEAQNMGYLDQSPMYKGMQIVTGQLSGVAYTRSFGHILRAVLGNDTVTGASTPWTHTFIPPQSPFSGVNNVPLPSYSITVQRQGAQARRYVGMFCTSLTITFAQGGLLKYDSSWIGRDAEAISTVTPTFLTEVPFQLTATLNRAGSAFGDFQEFSFSVETPIDLPRLIANTDKIVRGAFNGHRTSSFSGTVDYNAETLYDDYKAWTSQAWAVTIAQSTNSFAINIPAGIVTDFSASAGGPGRLTGDVTITPQYDSATSRAFDMVLVNVQSTIY